MVVQLRALEKALEDFTLQKNVEEWSVIVDKYLDENAQITSSASSKLHDMLYKMYLNQNQNPPENVQPENEFEAIASNKDPRVYFLMALNRLAPCLINKDQLELWWDKIADFAINSTGNRRELSDQALNFIQGVVSGSFYEFSDSSQIQLVQQNILLFGRNILLTYLQLKKINDKELSDEQLRFMRQNCRDLFTLFAQRRTYDAFETMNEYFVNPKYRHQILDLTVECFSKSQHSKLFKVYESKFFESLLLCLEHDQSRIIIQLAVTALSMLLVHICHKLTTDKLYCRIFAIFGRASSWHSSHPSSYMTSQKTTMGLEDDEKYIDEFAEPTNEPMSSDKVLATTKVGSWEVHPEEEVEPEWETIKVVSLFTFLYGLFPLNIIEFCHHCDEYLAKHQYTKTFKDYWSRFMVTGKAERIIRQFRVDPLVVMSSPEAELSNAVERFRKMGSALQLSSICMSRRVVDLNKSEPETEIEADEQKYLENHKKAFQMDTPSSAAHWYRELLLMRNELAFANFARDMSEQRAVRWQKRAFNLSVTESKNEELFRQNKILRDKVVNLEAETQKAVRSARTIMRERSAYETKILNRNKEFRNNIKELELKILDLTKTNESSKFAEKEAIKSAANSQTKAEHLENELTNLKSDYSIMTSKLESLENCDKQKRTVEAPSSDPSLVDQLKLSIEQMKIDNSNTIDSLNKEIIRLQKEVAQLAANGSASIKPQSSQIDLDAERNAIIAKLKMQNEELSRRCIDLEHELRARRVYEEERLNGLQASLSSTRPYLNQDALNEQNKFRGRGGAQGVPRRPTQL